MKKINNSIEKGVKFLAGQQEKDGSFLCLLSTKFDDYSKAEKAPAIVPSNMVLSSLMHLKETDEIRNIKKRVADFLLTQKGDYWSFNYWFKDSQKSKDEPYPDDIDDTFCALAALYEYDPELFDGEVMGKITIMLTSTEDEEGGPYDMWLLPPDGRDGWKRTDLVVNSNVAFFLSLQDIELPNVTKFIEDKIDDDGYDFPYNGIYPAIYFISRFYKGKKTKRMVDLVLSKREADGKWENPLRTALAVSALINFMGEEILPQLEDSINYLIDEQSKGGGWEPYSFFFHMKTPKKTLYAGSDTITTALCLEAMNKFDNASNGEVEKSKEKTINKEENDIYEAVVKDAKKRFSEFDGDLKKLALKTLKKTLSGDKDIQIVLLPYLFASSFGQKLDKELVIQLGLSNLYGWVAYTIYDDFLDLEGNPELLPIANVCLREVTEIFKDVLPEDTKFYDFSKKILDKIDSANAWEVSNCRFEKKVDEIPDYGDLSMLADRSLGHALGPIAILFSLGYGEESPEVMELVDFFKNYIIARQLNDDAHDWEDDLERGQINAVGADILKKRNNLNVEKLQQTFWSDVAHNTCADILRYTELARKNINNLSIITDKSLADKLLTPIESSANKALKEREEALKFLKAYE